ncbi:hypothetical protein HDV06_006527 [Boothiomyces sp. JEL0866]|nr:hypothetical protein HDV06_006527 [Boothiomyces sp. JEL0866]
MLKESQPISEKTQSHSHFLSIKSNFIAHLVIVVLIYGYTFWNIAMEGAQYFYYLTHWNWLTNLIYFTSALLMSFSHLKQAPINSSWAKVHYALFSVIQPLSWLVSTVFWALLAKSLVFGASVNTLDRYTGAASHVFNLVFPLIELFMCTISTRFIDIIYVYVVSVLYFVMLLITHIMGMDWPYSFLDTLNGGVNPGFRWLPLLAFQFGVLVMLFLFHSFSMLLIRGRNSLAKRMNYIDEYSDSGTVLV